MRSIHQAASAEELVGVHEAVAGLFRQPVLGVVHTFLSADGLAVMVAGEDR